MASLPSNSLQYPQRALFPVDSMLNENLVQALEIAIQSQNSQAILQVLDTIKSRHSSGTSMNSVTASMNDLDLMNQFEAYAS